MLSHSFASMDTPGALELFYRKVLVTERSEVLRAGDFVLRTTSLRSWTAQGPTALDPEKNAFAFFRLAQGRTH